MPRARHHRVALGFSHHAHEHAAASLAFPQHLGRWVTDSLLRRPVGTTRGPIPQLEAEAQSNASDSTELRMLPDGPSTGRGAGKQTRRIGDEMEKSRSLIPDEQWMHNRCPHGETVRPTVTLKGCLPKGFHLPVAFLPKVQHGYLEP